MTPSGEANDLVQFYKDVSKQLESKESIYLKITKENGREKVVVVQGRFWKWVAAVCCYFGKKSYNLNNISNVFKNELIKAKFANDTERVMCKYAIDLFADLLTSKSFEWKLENSLPIDTGNLTIGIQDIKQLWLASIPKVAIRIESPMKEAIPVPPRAQQPSLSVFEKAYNRHFTSLNEILFKRKLDLALLDNTQSDKERIEKIRHLIEDALDKWLGTVLHPFVKDNEEIRQKYGKGNSNSLARIEFEHILRTLYRELEEIKNIPLQTDEDVSKWVDSFTQICKCVEEGRWLMHAHGFQTTSTKEQRQAKIMLLAIEFRNFITATEFFLETHKATLAKPKQEEIQNAVTQARQQLSPLLSKENIPLEAIESQIQTYTEKLQKLELAALWTKPFEKAETRFGTFDALQIEMELDLMALRLEQMKGIEVRGSRRFTEYDRGTLAQHVYEKRIREIGKLQEELMASKEHIQDLQIRAKVSLKQASHFLQAVDPSSEDANAKKLFILEELKVLLNAALHCQKIKKVKKVKTEALEQLKDSLEGVTEISGDALKKLHREIIALIQPLKAFWSSSLQMEHTVLYKDFNSLLREIDQDINSVLK